MKVPVVMQFDSSDCGVACASSICSYYKKQISLSRLRAMMGTDAYGTSISGLTRALESIGFEVAAVSTPKSSIAEGDFTMPAIARQITEDGLAHYVVLYEVSGGKVTVMDPAESRPVKCTLDEFLDKFDGTLILMSPTDKFYKIRDDRRSRSISGKEIIKPHIFYFIVAIALSVAISFFGIVMANFNRDLLDELIPSDDVETLLKAGAIILLVTLVYLLFVAIRGHIILIVSQKIEKYVSFGYFRHIFHLPISFFSTRKTGDVITRFQDSAVIKNILTSTTIAAIIDLSMAIIVGSYLCSVSHQLFFISVLMVVLNAILIYLFREPYRRINNRAMEQNSRLNSKIIDYLSAIETVKASSYESNAMDKVEAEFVKVLALERKEGILSNLQTTFSTGLVQIGNLAILVVGGLLVMDSWITIGTLIAFVTLSTYFIEPIQDIVELQLKIQEVKISMLRMSEVYDAEAEDTHIVPIEGFDGTIRNVSIEGVDFAYGNRDPVLHDINLDIKEGEKVALVGRSGCGKTTLTKLLLKMYLPKTGEISYNGIGLSHLYAADVRKSIGYVPQNVQTFSGTLEENLTLGLSVSREELDRVCQMTGCDRFIKRLPAGYESYLDDRGGGLSGGEKQRLAIARAIMRKPSFLILDEATANMDYFTEKLTTNLIFEGLGDIPMLIVAHKLSTIRRCDRIYVMDEGHIVESGTHEELLASGGLYSEMWENQVGSNR